ncbi:MULTISPECIES: hypothetical protein [unclassified Curtobacterium]|uniref:hypothetical protein n=1 Tax=unclassified Curtobacterium TaxID=257496 RepID=UPI0014045C4C|nr:MULTISPECIES: hypothetical protein [unclassified Curtobacterium]
MGIWTRQREGHDLSNLIHHSDRGVQYRAIGYSDRLAEAGAVASVGSKGDSYDNALAEAVNSIFKAELIRNRGPWRGIDDLEIATMENIDLVQPAPPPRRTRHGPTRRVRAEPLSAQNRSGYRRSGTTEPPLNPGRNGGVCRG